LPTPTFRPTALRIAAMIARITMMTMPSMIRAMKRFGTSA
jgi:hypothetical protein